MRSIESCFRPFCVPCLSLGLIALLGSSSTLCSQSIPETHWTTPRAGGQSGALHRLPNPVRTAGHHEPISDSIPGESSWVDVEPDFTIESSWGLGYGNGGYQHPLNGLRQEPKHAHQILRAPTIAAPGEQAATGKSLQKKLVHPPYSSHRRRMQPEPPTLPGANQREIWKTPFSYGYFGASGTRHWSLHHGYRDRYTEWRLR
jgi:hypothetical protein